METYFLSSLESSRFTETRTCVFRKRMRFPTGKDAVLVEISPPVIGPDFGLGDNEIDLLVLANRYEGATLFPIDKFPCHIFITRPLVEGIEERDEVRKEELEILAWGELYPTR